MSRRHTLARPLIGIGAAGAAGLAGVLALAPVAHAAPTDAPSSTTSGGASSDGTTSTAPGQKKVAVEEMQANYGLKKIRIGVQQKQGSYVPPASTTVGTKITISQVGGPFGTTPYVTDCVTAADTRIDADAPSASFCEFVEGGLPAARRAALSGRQLRAITKPVDGANTPFDQAYFVLPGATVTITQSSVNDGYVTDPASPVTLEPCQNPLLDVSESRAAAAAPTCDSEQVILEDGGLPPVATKDSARTTEAVAVPIAIASNDTAKAPLQSVAITAGATHGTARLFSTEATDPSPSSSASTSPSTDDSTSPGTDDTTSTSDEPSPTETITLDADSRRAVGVRRLAAVTSYRAVYTPAAGFTGVDTFDYTITTANGTATARVTVTVTGVAASASASASGASASSGTAPLADTGTQSGDLLGYAAALIAAGGGALAIGRQRRRGRHAR